MSLIVRDKNFYKKVLAIAIPIALQNMVTSAVGMLDTIMLGQLGEVAMSASSLANQVGFIFQMINFGLTGGAGILTSQYWGRGDSDSIRRVMSLTYRISMSVAVLFAIGATFFPEMLMRIFTNDEAIIYEGIRYLNYCGVIYLANAFTITTTSILRTVGTVKIALFSTVASLLVNAFFNYGLIFGKLGMPQMGVAGAALATMIARLVEFAIITVFLFRVDQKICFRVKDFWQKVDMATVRLFMKYGAPVLCNELFWSLGNSMSAVVLGRIGAEAVAANSICDIVFQMTSFFIWGAANAASVMTGNTIGAGEKEKAREQSKTFIVISLGLGVVTSLMILGLRGFMVDFYNVADSTKEIAYSIMNLMCFVCIFQAMGNINMFGTLRGGGDSRFVLVCDVSAMWGLSVPLGFLSGLVLHWPIWLVYLCLRSSEIFTCIAGLIRLCGTRWMVDVTQEKKEDSSGRLAAEGE